MQKERPLLCFWQEQPQNASEVVVVGKIIITHAMARVNPSKSHGQKTLINNKLGKNYI